jgi:hypothetical protein
VGIGMKEDVMSKAMKEFWGTEEVSEDKLSPENAAQAFEEEGRSIREKIEAGVEETEDLTPETPIQVQKKKPAPFDLGGLDEMNRKQLARERGMGMSLGGSREKLPFEEKYRRDMFKEEFADTKSELEYKRAERKLLLQQARINIAQQSAQFRNQNLTTAELTRSMREESTKKRYEAGLPVNEGPLDFIAGGKRKVYEVIDGKTVDTGRYERVGGLFGAAKEGYSFYRKAEPHLSSAAVKTGVVLRDMGDAVISGGDKAVKYTKKAKDEFVSDARGVFKVAKTRANTTLDSAKIGVDSFYDKSEIGRAMDSLLETKPGNRFANKFASGDENFLVKPKNIKRHTRVGGPSYEGRDLLENKSAFGITPVFTYEGKLHNPRQEMPRVAKTSTPSYNEKMINNTMAQMNKDVSAIVKGNSAPVIDRAKIRDII